MNEILPFDEAAELRAMMARAQDMICTCNEVLERPFDPENYQRAFEAAIDALDDVVAIGERIEATSRNSAARRMAAIMAEGAEASAIRLSDDYQAIFG
ncbi:hypothetical protein [Methylocella sp.]|uniref:hypothetical protein n=1 Tax=Methylocella sp. TaxID=1978226 RepID=UPI003783393B